MVFGQHSFRCPFIQWLGPVATRFQPWPRGGEVGEAGGGERRLVAAGVDFAYIEQGVYFLLNKAEFGTKKAMIGMTCPQRVVQSLS